MKVSVIICSIGRETIFDTLKSLKSQNYKEFEILVVSSHESIKVGVEDLGAKFIFTPNTNLSFQKNLGIKESKGEFICFTDDDAIVETSWIKTLIECFTDEQIVCVGGKIELAIDKKIPRELEKMGEGAFKGFLGGSTLDVEKGEIKDPLLWGSNICFRKKIFDEIGFFDERIGRTPTSLLCMEEVEIQDRILKNGFKIVYEPKALVWHKVLPERLTVNYFLRRAFWQGYSEVIATRRYGNIKKFVEIIKTEFLKFLMKEKIFENIFETFATEDINEKILAYQKIGRSVGFLDLVKSE